MTAIFACDRHNFAQPCHLCLQGKIDKQAEEIKRLKKPESMVIDSSAHVEALARVLARKNDAIKALVESLKKYGGHVIHCAVTSTVMSEYKDRPIEDWPPCTCGWREALTHPAVVGAMKKDE